MLCGSTLRAGDSAAPNPDLEVTRAIGQRLGQQGAQVLSILTHQDMGDLKAALSPGQLWMAVDGREQVVSNLELLAMEFQSCFSREFLMPGCVPLVPDILTRWQRSTNSRFAT